MNLEKICDIIILIAAVIAASKTIYTFIKKPVKDISDKINKKEEEHIKAIIQKEVPELLKQHSEAVKNERNEESNKRNNLIVDTIESKIDELKESNSQEIEDVRDLVFNLKEAQIGILRYNMLNIYERFLDEKKIPIADREAFYHMYENYTAMGGNGYMNKICEDLMKWETIE